jgi:hypothetical protein
MKGFTMAKFNLKEEMNRSSQLEKLASGEHAARIIHVVDLGELRRFDNEPEAKPCLGITFQLTHGERVPVELTKSGHRKSTLIMIAEALGVDELEQFAGCAIVLDIEAEGQYPKPIGYSSIEWYDGAAPVFPEAELITLLYGEGEDSLDIPANLALIKQLPKLFTRHLLKASKKSGV